MILTILYIGRRSIRRVECLIWEEQVVEFSPLIFVYQLKFLSKIQKNIPITHVQISCFFMTGKMFHCLIENWILLFYQGRAVIRLDQILIRSCCIWCFMSLMVLVSRRCWRCYGYRHGHWHPRRLMLLLLGRLVLIWQVVLIVFIGVLNIGLNLELKSGVCD